MMVESNFSFLASHMSHLSSLHGVKFVAKYSIACLCLTGQDGCCCGVSLTQMCSIVWIGISSLRTMVLAFSSL